MRKFLVPPLILMIISGGLIGYFLWRLPPFEGHPPIIDLYHNRLFVFLFSAFLFLSSLSSLILYLICRLAGDYQQPRYTYRRSLRQGLLLGLGVVAAAILLLTHTANLMTLILLIAVIVSLEFTLREK